MATKITITNSSFGYVGKVFSIPESADVQIDADNNVYHEVGTVLDIRKTQMPDELKALIAALQPFETTPEELRDVLQSLRDTGNNEAAQNEAVQKSAIWAAVKDKAPEIGALLIKTAVELWKQ